MNVAKLSLAFGLLLCVSMNPLAREQSSPDMVAAAMPTIQSANTEWIIAMRQGDVETIVKPYALDAVFVTAEGESIRGRAAIRDLYRTRLSGTGSVVSATIEHRGAATGDHGLVFEWGFGAVTTRSADGSVTTRGGPYLTVWKLEEHEKWDILRNVVL